MAREHILIEGVPWPRRGFVAEEAALLLIDMQVDFCAPGGWIDQLGVGLANTRRPIPVLQSLLARARAVNLHVFHTREGHRADSSDLNRNKQWRTRKQGLGIGDTGANGRVLVRGEPGWALIPELSALPSETVFDKPGKGAFFATDLHHVLQCRNVKTLMIGGVTTDCCVQSTMRDAVDLGYECLLIEDGCDAIRHEDHTRTVDIFKKAQGRLGAVARSDSVLGFLG